MSHLLLQAFRRPKSATSPTMEALLYSHDLPPDLMLGPCAQASRRRLSGMGVRVLGAALNAVKGPEPAYGYYGSYYSYYKTKDEKKAK